MVKYKEFPVWMKTDVHIGSNLEPQSKNVFFTPTEIDNPESYPIFTF
jgi:hypothetical protein